MSLAVSGSGRRLELLPTSAKSRCASWLTAQQCEIAAAHHEFGAREDAVDALSQRIVCPLDGGNVTRGRIEQDRSDLAARHARSNAVERAELKGQPFALMQRELLAADEWAGALSGEMALQAFNGVPARGDVVVARDDEAVGPDCGVGDEPQLMVAVRIIEQDVAAVMGVHKHSDRREIIKTDRLRRSERLRRGRNDDSGR